MLPTPETRITEPSTGRSRRIQRPASQATVITTAMDAKSTRASSSWCGSKGSRLRFAKIRAGRVKSVTRRAKTPSSPFTMAERCRNQTAVPARATRMIKDSSKLSNCTVPLPPGVSIPAVGAETQEMTRSVA